MATSGTVGATVFNTRKIVDRGYRLAKVPPQVVAGEMLQTALDELYLILSGLANEGVPLWCIQKNLLPLYAGQIAVPSPVGTVSVIQALIRDVSRLTGTAFSTAGTATFSQDGDLTTATTLVATLGNMGLHLDSTAIVTTVGILPNATGTWEIVLEHSDDGVTYVPFYTNTLFAAVAGQWQWFDFEELPSSLYWRIRATGTTILDITELVFANNPSEITMAPLNKDDYFNLPNKMFRGKPVEYWQDRQIPPVMQIWPAADSYSTFRQIVMQSHRALQDVGSLQQSIEMPPRWFDAVSQKLGLYLSKVTESSKLTLAERQDLKTDVEALWHTAWAEERDPSPIHLAPDISPYTK